jgi:hypothetical protein
MMTSFACVDRLCGDAMARRCAKWATPTHLLR